MDHQYSITEHISFSFCNINFFFVTFSNPKVQVRAVDLGIIPQLLRMLSLETSLTLRNRVLYALSSIIRHFPYAQEKFVNLGGLHVLAHLFAEAKTEKLRVKAVTLVSDLITEKVYLS